MRTRAAAILIAFAGTLCVTPPASADTPRCVSRHEYDRIANGMSMTKVHSIFDTQGDLTGLGAPNDLYYYDTCTGRGAVQVVFSPRGRVLSKAARFF